MALGARLSRRTCKNIREIIGCGLWMVLLFKPGEPQDVVGRYSAFSRKTANCVGGWAPAAAAKIVSRNLTWKGTPSA